jgi:hypothetical protein
MLLYSGEFLDSAVIIKHNETNITQNIIYHLLNIQAHSRVKTSKFVILIKFVICVPINT